MWSTDNGLAVFIDGNSGWLMVVCLVAAAALFTAWYGGRRAKPLIAAGMMALLGAGLAVADHAIVTPAERVESAVYGLTTSFQQQDLDRTLSYVSARQIGLRTMIAAGMKLVEVEDDLRVTDMQVELSAGNSRATSHFRANATLDSPIYGNLGRRPSRWLLTWQLEEDEWRVIKVQRLNPINGDEMHVLAQSEG